jgi:anti-anti-sigma regulatory factor
MSQLDIKISVESPKVVVALSGQINEDSNFESILATTEPEIIFDFDRVESINSCGIRDWIKMLSELSQTKMTYKNCRQIIIEQMNMVHGFIKEGASVESFYAPYFCESCEHEMQHLIETKDINNSQAPEVSCPNCDNDSMDFDAIADQYFQFLNQIKG